MEWKWSVCLSSAEAKADSNDRSPSLLCPHSHFGTALSSSSSPSTDSEPADPGESVLRAKNDLDLHRCCSAANKSTEVSHKW